MRVAKKRKGASLVVVLALLAVCSVILLQLLTSSLQQRIQLRQDLQREQTLWILRAGVQHAAGELKQADDQLPEDVSVKLPGFESAKVIFTTESDDPKPATMKISAQIGDEDNPHQRTVVSSQFKTLSNNSKPIQE